MPYNPNIRVLVVDDFSTMRRIIKNILRQLGFNNVVEADDGTTAWDVLHKDKIEFIISDWNMPQMTGIELLRKVRASEEFADLPFLMVTAEAQQEKGKTDTQYKKQRIYQHLFPWIMYNSIFVHCLGPACQIADIQRNKGQDAG